MPSRKRGWCSTHYTRWRRHGDPTVTLRGVACSADGCDLPNFGRGMCRKHYARWRKHGTTDLVPRLPASPVPCAGGECDRPAVSYGFCDKHYRRWRTHGSPDVIGPRGPSCTTCGHPLRSRIDLDLLADDSYVEVGARYDIHPGPLAKHGRECLGLERGKGRMPKLGTAAAVDRAANRLAAVRRYVAAN